VGKGYSNTMKAAGLKLAAAVVQGLPRTDRNMATVQAEAWKLFEKQVKVGGFEPAQLVSRAALPNRQKTNAQHAQTYCSSRAGLQHD
jgi:hypothetical protein